MGRKARLDLVLDCADPQALAEFWREALAYRTYFAGESAVVLVPTDDGGNASPLVLQRVPEAKVAKNRMHVDLVTDEVEPEVARLVGLGATRVDEGVQSFGDVQWVRMADPVGNEFCVCTGVEW